MFLDIFSSTIMNDLFMIFTSRLKVDAKCVYQQSNWMTVANYFGTTPAAECMGICILSLAHGSEQRGSDVICVKNWSGKFFFKFNQGICPWMAFAWIFFWIFLVVLGKSFIGNIWYFGAQLFSVVWPLRTRSRGENSFSCNNRG